MCIKYNLKYGFKVAFASPENKPNPIHVGKIEAKLVGRFVNHAGDLSQQWHYKAKQYIHENFKFIDLDSYDLDDVLLTAKSMVRRYGIKILVVDPYNKVRLKRSLSKNIVDYTNDYLAAIDEFARQNDILIFLVAHPRKPGLGEGKSYMPSFYDIKGGGEFFDMSPHGLLVHRNYEEETVIVKTLKVKFYHLGKGNEEVVYRWNKNNGRYFSYDQYSGGTSDNSNWLSPEDTTEDIFAAETIMPNTRFDVKPQYDEDAPF
jgi:twinkle protein